MRAVKPALLLVAALGFGQQKPAFEVASVKLNTGGPESGFSVDIAPSGRVTVRNMDLWNLIRTAYHVRDLEMSGGPTWTKERRFDIHAQPAEGAAPVARELTMQMLQTLLEARFRLKWHRESREGQAYALTIARGGAKLPPAHPGPGRTKFGDLDTPSMTLDMLCQILESDVHRPVVNRTELSGPFAIRLKWASDRELSTVAAEAPDAPLLSAIQEQLGLKLEQIKTAVDVFVIDSVETPAEN
jgi:uncharacterized protein (TIGR03435 family)